MKKKIDLANYLQNITYHVTRIVVMQPGEETTFSPVPGLLIKCRIEKGHSEDSIWDSVYLNDNDHCGNRHGGVKAFTQMVLDYVHNHNVEIINAEYEEKAKNLRAVQISLGL